MNDPMKAPTGHTIGATYRSCYWGYVYRVLGPAGEHGVRVLCLDGGPSQTAHVGVSWTHRTHLEISKDPRM